MQFVHWILLSIHVLASAAWFGAMLYSLLVLHPRARSFFNDSRKFEEFIAHLAAGARWKVLTIAALIAGTGLGLMILSAQTINILLLVKIILFVPAITLFCYTSWILWPARLLASAEEIPKFNRTFRLVAIALLGLIGINMALGVLGASYDMANKFDIK